MLADESRFSYVSYILNIAVFTEYRRYGVGSYLLHTVINQYRSESLCGGVYLHTLAENKANVRFYEKNGFQRVQVNEGWFACVA